MAIAESQPTWDNFKTKTFFPPLQGDITVDVAIVGGGLFGLLAAYYLAAQGKQVAVLEGNEIGQGATGVTTAFLTQSLDTDLTDLVDLFGQEKARQVWQAHGQAIDDLEKIVTEEKIDCEFVRCPNYIYARTDRQYRRLVRQAELAQKLGLPLSLGKNNSLPFENFGYAHSFQQAKFHPLKFLYALADRAADKGALIFEKTEVQTVTGSGVVVLASPKATVKAGQVVIATYKPFNNPKQTFLKKGLYKSYVLEASIPQGVLPEALYEDLYNPYHYFRVDRLPGADRLIIGGEDHRAELPMDEQKNFLALQAYLDTILPDKNYALVRRWTGLILEPTDGLALIGLYQPNYFLGTAFSGNGMTYAAIAAKVAAETLSGQGSSCSELFDPTRRPTAKQLARKGRDYVGEFAGGAVKNFFRSR